MKCEKNAAAAHAHESIWIQNRIRRHILTVLNFSYLHLPYFVLAYLTLSFRIAVIGAGFVCCAPKSAAGVLGVFGQQKGRTPIRHATFSKSGGGCRQLHTKSANHPRAGGVTAHCPGSLSRSVKCFKGEGSDEL
jgi:hypothetical protein